MALAPEVAARLLFDRIPWGVDLAGALCRVPFDGELQPNLAFLEREIGAGRATAWRITDQAADGQPSGVMVGRVEEDVLGREFVVIALASFPGCPLVGCIGAAVEQLAAGHGCRSIRFHTARPGMIHVARSAGYTITEIILRKYLPAHG